MNVKLRYMGTNLGFLWNALEPLLTFVLLYVVFTSIRERPEDFAIYLLTGVTLYHVFTRGTIAGLGSLRGNKNIITSLNIGNEFFPIVAVGSIALTTIVEIVVLLALFPVFGFVPSFTIVLLPLVVLLMLVLVMGLSYLLSVLSIFLRDIQPIWGVIVHAVFFISPIFWYVDNVDGILLDILQFNPPGLIIDLAHKVAVFGEIPPLSDWLYITTFVLAIFFFGFFIFKKYENRIAEEL